MENDFEKTPEQIKQLESVYEILNKQLKNPVTIPDDWDKDNGTITDTNGRIN